MTTWPKTDREWARAHLGCNATTCPNGKCKATGECQDALPKVEAPPIVPTYCTVSGPEVCRELLNPCPGCPERIIPPFLALPADPRLKPTNPKDAIGDKKVPLWLCSPIAKAHWAAAQFVGMVKYGAWNWRNAGIRSSIYLAAIQRHLDAYLSGEEVDPVDQTSHLGHIMACAAILIDAKAAGKLNDDRPPSVGLRETYAAVEKQMELARTNYASMNPHHFTIADSSP